MAYRLSPPTQVVFIVSLVLVILALLARYTDVTIPVVSAHSFETLLLAFLLLLAETCFAASKSLRACDGVSPYAPFTRPRHPCEPTPSSLPRRSRS